MRRSAWSAGGPASVAWAVEGGTGRLLTVREVAERLAVSTATVYALCQQGDIRHARISNAIRIARADLEAFISRRVE